MLLRMGIRHIVTKVRNYLRLIDSKLAWISGWLQFRSRVTDLYIVSYPRSGTTLLQMLLYQLLSDGKLEFSHISEVVPFLERSVQLGHDLNRIPMRRVFKTHLHYKWLRWWKGKYIYVARDGRDVVLSYFEFYKAYLAYEGSFNHFFALFVRGELQAGSWKKHVAAWKNNQHDTNILHISYEELLASPESCICRIATFCDIPLTLSRLVRSTERTRFDFMKAHEHLFDHADELLWERGVRRGQFIREGKVGQHQAVLSSDQLRYFADTR